MTEFSCGTKIYAGNGAVKILKEFGAQRLLVVTDPYFAKKGTARHLAELSGSPHWEVYDHVKPDPTVTLAAEGTAKMKEFEPDLVVALGGGSAMDCAKAMVYFSGLSLHFIAIPTTSGSGSEVTDFAILTHDGVKHPLVDPILQPDMAILSGNLLDSLPKKLIAETGFDLISHGLEAWVATGAGQISDALALEALRTAFSLLPRSYAGDTAARLPLHRAATMAGMAFSSAGLGLCHAIAHALGGEFHIPHGRLNAILLPAVMEVQAAISPGRYSQLAKQLGFGSGGDSLALRHLKNSLIRLRKQLELPEDLQQAGIDPRQLTEKMETLVTAALADPCCATNPVTPNSAMVRQILYMVMGHE